MIKSRVHGLLFIFGVVLFILPLLSHGIDRDCAQRSLFKISTLLNDLGVNKHLVGPWVSWNISWNYTYRDNHFNSETQFLTKHVSHLLAWMRDSVGTHHGNNLTLKKLKDPEVTKSRQDFAEALWNDIKTLSKNERLSIVDLYRVSENFSYLVSAVNPRYGLDAYDRKIRTLGTLDHEITAPLFIPIPTHIFPTIVEANILRATPITFLPLIKSKLILPNSSYEPYPYFKQKLSYLKRLIKADKEILWSTGKLPNNKAYETIHDRLLFEKYRVEQFQKQGTMHAKERQALEVVYYYLHWHAKISSLNLLAFETYLKGLSISNKEFFINSIIALGKEPTGLAVEQTGKSLPTFKIKEMRPLMLEAFSKIETIFKEYQSLQ